MQFDIPHAVTYNFEGRATIQEVAKSLLSQEKLFKDALSVLEAAFPNLQIEAVRVDLRSVTQDSPLRETLIGVVIGAYSPELGEDMPDLLQTLFGVNIPDSYDSLVSVIILLVAIYGVDWLRKKILPGDKNEAIDKEKSRLVSVAAQKAAITEDHLEEAIEKALSKRQGAVIRASMDFMAPAKRNSAKSVGVSGGEAIGQPAIDAVPSDVDLALFEPESEVTPIENVVVRFRRHDLDRKTGWAATIDALSKDRKPLHLAPHINADSLFDQKSVRADVLVTSVRNAGGDFVPSMYYIQSIRDDAD